MRLMLLTALTLLQSCLVAVAQIVGDPVPSVSFKVVSSGNDNFFLRDTLTSGQLLMTSRNNTSSLRRLVVALPAGNTGALVYFLPSDSDDASGLDVGLLEGSVKSATADYFNVGLQADLIFDRNATLGVTIIGAVRAMRGKYHVFLPRAMSC